MNNTNCINKNYNSYKSYKCDNACKCLDDYPLGMAYVPWQKFRDLYCNEHEALKHGTIFKELYLPWVGRSC